MEQPFSTSKVTVEYFDPHDVYKLLAPGLIPRFPLRDLHWQSHAGPLRSISTLHVELLPHGPARPGGVTPLGSPNNRRSPSGSGRDDGFQTHSVGGRSEVSEVFTDFQSLDITAQPPSKGRRHQIPGLRRTPYLKVLLVRCDDNDIYKSHTRGEIREWIKQHTPPTRKANNQENHDAFEWLIVHVVIPNTVAATQPRVTGKGADGSTAERSSSTSRWGKSSSTLLEKFRSDFNSTGKHAVDRVAQIRIGINDVPYDILPRVVPAVPTGYTETQHDIQSAWEDLVGKIKSQILSSFDMRVTQYEEDIKEKDSQRSLPGWNFCTFFILKEGLARGFESVGLVDDALVGYDELSVGLDAIIQAQATTGSETHGGTLLSFTEDLKKSTNRALAAVNAGQLEFEDDEPEDLQSNDNAPSLDRFVEDIPISATKKPYRDLILANNVSVFDFRCYIFARQISLLLRLGNAWSTREELLAKLKEQQDSVLHGVAPQRVPPKRNDEAEDLAWLGEICKRTLAFIPVVSQAMRKDIIAAMTSKTGDTDTDTDADGTEKSPGPDAALDQVMDNMVASFAFSIAQQVLAQTSTKALPIPPSSPAQADSNEPKTTIPEPKTMMHPARSSSLHIRQSPRPPSSLGAFTGPAPARRNSLPEADAPAAKQSQFLKAGLEELASRRAELYSLCRNILKESGKKRDWSDGWSSVPVYEDADIAGMEDVSLDDDGGGDAANQGKSEKHEEVQPTMAGFDNRLLRMALDSSGDFYRLYETLTEKALRHYMVAGYKQSEQENMADLAVLKFHLEDYAAAANYFYRTTPFFGESGWSMLELTMLVMYSKCLEKLQRMEEYVRVVLKLLSKAAAVERERASHLPNVRIGKTTKAYGEVLPIKGFVGGLLTASKVLTHEVRVPLTNLIESVVIDGPPVYADKQDSFSLALKIKSLLAEELNIQSAKVRMSALGTSLGELWLENRGETTLRPGKNKMQLHSNVMVPGQYQIDQIQLLSGNMCLYYERELGQPPNRAIDILRSPYVAIYQRTGSLDVSVSASTFLQLDRNCSIDVRLSTGWNEVTSCELRIRSATGGLRLLTGEGKVVETSHQLSRPAESGLFCFDAIPSNTTLTVRIPFTVEQELHSVSVKVETNYTTDQGSFTLSKSPAVPVALSLGVNVQDVFKHSALFSRFTVSTASISPLRLYKSELEGCETFDSHFGIPPANPILVFPKQPASLMYKITRKVGAKPANRAQKTMRLTLYYSVLQDEIEGVVERSLNKALEGTALWQYARLVVSSILDRLRNLSMLDLERAALLGELSTAFLTEVNWQKQFTGLGTIQAGVDDVAVRIFNFILEWQKTHANLVIPTPDPEEHEPHSMLIPVEIPSVAVIHTADIQLQNPPAAPGSGGAGSGSKQHDTNGPPTVFTNQLLPATLHLKWTRAWDTGPGPATDLEFSYEVNAPLDTWLLGGRRKGHFVIPAPDAEEAEAEAEAGAGVGAGVTSTPDTEADIPLLMVPLREGWLPYPSVDIREVHSDGPGSPGLVSCETDYRNLGEAVQVVADRGRVTLSLDASGPGGGPLVLESEGLGLERGSGLVDEGRMVV